MMTDLFSLAGRTALITGGSRGIGRMIAAGFIAQGARVYISSRKAAACEAIAAELSKEWRNLLAAAAGRLNLNTAVEILRVDSNRASSRV